MNRFLCRSGGVGKITISQYISVEDRRGSAVLCRCIIETNIMDGGALELEKEFHSIPYVTMNVACGGGSGRGELPLIAGKWE